MRNQAFSEGQGRAAPKAGDMVPLHDGTQGQLWAPGGGPNKWHVVGPDRTPHIWDSKTGSSLPAPDTGMALAQYQHALGVKYGQAGYHSMHWGTADVGRSLNVTAIDIKQLKASARGKIQKAKR
jgi:hypothetical protein